MIEPQLSESRPGRASDRILRQFAGLWFLIFGGLALWHGLAHGRLGLAWTLAALAMVIGLPGIARPRAVELIYAAAIALAEPLGKIISRLLLTALFFTVFTPLALLLRVSRRDSLSRRFRSDQETYWTPKSTPPDIRSYLRGY